MSITPTTLVAAYAIPTSISQIWTPDTFYLHDWANPFSVTNSYRIDKLEARTGTEYRTGYADKPVRSVIASFSSRNEISDSGSLDRYLQKLSIAGTLIPLFSDQTETTTVSTLTTLTCNTQYKRFYVNARILIVTPTSQEIAVIQSVSSSSIVVKTNLSAVKPVGTFIYPLMECSVVLESPEAYNNTARKITSQITLMENYGAESIPASASYNLSTQIFPSELNARDAVVFSYLREGGTSQYAERIEYYGTGSRGKKRFMFTCSFNREEFWEFLTFFDSVRGGLKSFYFQSPSEDFNVLDYDTVNNEIEVMAYGEDVKWVDKKYISLETANNKYVLAIDSVSRSGSTDTISLIDTLPAIAKDDIIKITTGYLCRFSSSEFTETWRTPNYTDITVEIIEIEQEKTTNITIESLV